MENEGCKPMDFTGKVMKGFVFVDIDVLNTKKKLEYWINLALDFNKKAKPSKKKKWSAFVYLNDNSNYF